MHEHNQLKLNILKICFNSFNTANNLTALIYPTQSDKALVRKHLISISVRLNTLSRKKNLSDRSKPFNSWTPYLTKRLSKKEVNPITGKPVLEYKSTAKGRRIYCELAARKAQGISLKWNGKTYRYSGCSSRCNNCPVNPIKTGAFV